MSRRNRDKRKKSAFNGSFDDFVMGYIKKVDEVNEARRKVLLDILRKRPVRNEDATK